jgi:hypothetical protein
VLVAVIFQCYVIVRISDRVFLDIVSILVLLSIHTYQKVNLAILKSGLIGFSVQSRRSRIKPSVDSENSCALLRIGRVSVAIRWVVHSYIRTIV